MKRITLPIHFSFILILLLLSTCINGQLLHNYRYKNDQVEYIGDICVVEIYMVLDLTIPFSIVLNAANKISESSVLIVGTGPYSYIDGKIKVTSSSSPNTISGTVTSSQGSQTFSIPVAFTCLPPPPVVNITKYWTVSNQWTPMHMVFFETDFNIQLIDNKLGSCTTNNSALVTNFQFLPNQNSVSITPNQSPGLGSLLILPVNLTCKITCQGPTTYTFNFPLSPLYINPPIDPLSHIQATDINVPGLDYNETSYGYLRQGTIFVALSNFTNGFVASGAYTLPVLGDMNYQVYMLVSSYQSWSYSMAIFGNNGFEQYDIINTYYPILLLVPPTSNSSISNDTVFQNIAIIGFKGSYYNNIKSLTQLNSNSYTNTNQYPFGYYRSANNSANEFTYKISVVVAPNCTQIQPQIQTYTQIPYTLITGFGIVDSAAPLIQWLDYSVSSDQNYLIVYMRITDNYSGLYTVTINSELFFASQYLLSGDKLDGNYQFKITLGYVNIAEITLFDFMGNTFTFANVIHNPQLTLLQTIPLPFYDKDILGPLTLFQFLPNIVDTSNGPQNVTLIFNTTNILVSYKPRLEYYLYRGNSLSEVTGNWDFTDKVYKINFQIPAKSLNTTTYYYIYPMSYYETINLFGDSAKLYVWSRYTDNLFPVVTNISLIGSPVHTIPSGLGINLGFKMNVTDRGNGLKGGYIEIVSLIDPNPYVFNFSAQHRISGDIYQGIYNFNISFNGNTCFNQTFRIQYVYLVDNAGNEGIYFPELSMGNSPLMEPFIREFSVVCQNVPIVSNPYISGFRVLTPSINSRSVNNRTIVISMKVGSDIGLSPRHDPVVYLSSYSFNTISIYHSSKSVFSNAIDYIFNTTLEYGYFADCPISISVYGLVDKHLNLYGYNTQMLKDSGYPYYILNNASNIAEPWIQSSNVLYPNGLDFAIYGLNLAVYNLYGSGILYVDYKDGNGFVIVDTILQNEPSVIRANLGVITKPSIQVKVVVGSLTSNIFTVNITPYSSILNPPVAPVSCPSNNSHIQCSGNGQCTQNGCQCISPFSGPDCSVKNQQLDPPILNPETPSVELSNQQIATNISVYAVRELDIYGNQVAFYPLDNWSFNNNTLSQTSTFQYNTLFNNNQTNITTTIQWFKEEANITYAYENVTIPPFTVKYSIKLDKYQFHHPINTLQIVMQVELSESTGDKCISQSYGSGQENLDDIQWMKLRVENQSFYGQFIRKGIVDGRIIVIKNSKLQNTIIPPIQTNNYTNNNNGIFIAINIPSYQQSILIDPYFSYLIENDDKDPSDQCNSFDNSSKGLSKQQIVGIIVGSIVGGIFIVLISVYIIGKKYRIMFSDRAIKLVKVDKATTK